MSEMYKRMQGDIDNGATVPQCYICKNWMKNEQCIAFPNGIPEEILTGQYDHRNSHKNDNGIKFDKI